MECHSKLIRKKITFSPSYFCNAVFIETAYKRRTLISNEKLMYIIKK